ncbi:MAG TPA: polysaccharide biosynthesis/export family protein, partial [Rhizomicrobium sp.]|nr:polysaccharide biosynthesis/export family protein [Rhizomicrobium sp.]
MPIRRITDRPRLGRILSAAGFVAPFLLAIGCWLAMPGDGLAQGYNSNNPLSILQQMQGGFRGLGPLNGTVDTTTSLQQSQVLQPSGTAPSSSQQPSRLEQIVSARAGGQLHQFGYDQLGVGREISVPETGAVADDYVMGPGDEVVVTLRGQENSDVRTNVDRNGRVVLPRMAPIPAAGRSFGSFRQDVDAAVRRAYVASTASVAIGHVRQISVMVAGEVNVPGQRTVTGLSSVVDALLLSNGVKKTGSLRNVRVIRAGHDYVTDLYSVLTGSGRGGVMRLADGDRIVVPPLGATVAIAGLVRRPGIYELPSRTNGMTARALLALAGGQEIRGRYRLAVQRIESDGRLVLAPLEGENSVVRDSEILRVELGADLAGAQATLSGGIGLAGQYAVTTGTKLSDLIRAPGALGTSPYTLFGLIVRKDAHNLLRSLVPFTPVAVLNGTEDQLLQSDDLIRPISVHEAQLLSFIVKTYLDKLALDQARIRNPLETQRADAAAVAVNAGSAANNNNNNANAGNNNVNNNNIIAAMQARANPAITPDNPFGLQPGALEASSTGQEDFSSVSADIQRANIIALLDTPAPGSFSAQRDMANQLALMNNGSALTGQVPMQVAQAQQTALAPTGQAANSQLGNAGLPLQDTSSNM